MLKFYNKRLINLNDVFEHEVSDLEVEDRPDPTIQEKLKVNVIVLILFFLSLGLLLFSLWYAFGKPKTYTYIRTITSGDLAVIHSKVDFGLNINSFLEHTTYDTATSYTFTVSNNNEHEINYRLKINQQKTNNSINLENLKYSLLENGIEVETGNIKDLNNNILNNRFTIKENTDTKFELKIWSINPIERSYKYIIEVVD